MNTVVVGLDGGGTKVAVEVVTLDGIVRGTGTAGSCNIAAVPVADAVEAARSAIQQAIIQAGVESSEVGPICAGIAGWSHTVRAYDFLQGVHEHFPNSKIQLLPDYKIAHTAALGFNAGIVVIAGTGSIAYGVTSDGMSSHRAGGYGHLIDDSGSGYGVGRAAIAAALRAADGSGEATSLLGALLGKFSLDTELDLIPLVYGGDLDRVAIAGLSAIVADAANAGDEAAIGILTGTGEALARLVCAAHDRLFSGDEGVSVAAVGGLWAIGGALSQAFDRGVRRFAPKSTISTPETPPVRGAVIRALKSLESM